MHSIYARLAAQACLEESFSVEISALVPSIAQCRNIPMTFGFLALSYKFISMRLEDWHLRREWHHFPFTLNTSALVSFKTSSGQTSIKVGFFPFPTLPQGHFFLNTLHWRGPLMAMIDRYWAVSWYVDRPSEEGWVVWVIAGVHKGRSPQICVAHKKWSKTHFQGKYWK